MTVPEQVADESEVFVNKWLSVEHWHRLLLLFESPALRRQRSLVEALGHELRGCALDSSEARVSTAKLGWWMQEWQQLANGVPRHPLTRGLLQAAGAEIDAEAGGQWIAAAANLASDEVDGDLPARQGRWLDFSRAQATATQPWLPLPLDSDAGVHALSLQIERLPAAAADLRRGRLPLPLSALARAGMTRAELGSELEATANAISGHAAQLGQALTGAGNGVCDPYRRMQAALARLLAAAIARNGASAWSGVRALPHFRAAFAVWRARRMTSVTGRDSPGC